MLAKPTRPALAVPADRARVKLSVPSYEGFATAMHFFTFEVAKGSSSWIELRESLKVSDEGRWCRSGGERRTHAEMAILGRAGEMWILRTLL